MKKRYLALLSIAVLVSFIVMAEEVKVPVAFSDLSNVIKQSIQTNFPDGQRIQIQKELDGERLVQYDVVIRSGVDIMDVEIAPDGKIIEIKKRKRLAATSSQKSQQQWTRSFNMDRQTFSTTGRNPYFILEVGHQLTLQNNDDKVIITVLKDTKVVDGIETRIVEEREWEDGELVEVSRNFFAICEQTNDVFYFGEEVDDYKEGQIVGHGGAWQAGLNGATAGIVMPGTFLLGARYYQEIAEGIAMDRAENTAMGLTVETPAGRFIDCVKVIETSPLESGESVKIYAPGIGLIDDDGFKLVDVRTGKSQ